ncbi:MAG: hypothetical protein DDT20_01223 [Firmicutes bacterium]|nr:hypothetical protein [Bacillota bacterium]
MSDTIKLELEGVEELRRKLGDPKLAKEPIKEMLKKAAALGKETAIPAISGGTGIAARSIKSSVRSRAMQARVYTRIAEPRAMSIEQGRPPGELVEICSLARWLTGSTTVTIEEFEQILEIQEAIKQGGTQGKGYMLATREALEKELPRLEEELLVRLEEEFYK